MKHLMLFRISATQPPRLYQFFQLRRPPSSLYAREKVKKGDRFIFFSKKIKKVTDLFSWLIKTKPAESRCLVRVILFYQASKVKEGGQDGERKRRCYRY